MNKEFGSVFVFGQNFATCWQKKGWKSYKGFRGKKEQSRHISRTRKKKLSLSDLDHTFLDVAIIYRGSKKIVLWSLACSQNLARSFLLEDYQFTYLTNLREKKSPDLIFDFNKWDQFGFRSAFNKNLNLRSDTPKPSLEPANNGIDPGYDWTVALKIFTLESSKCQYYEGKHLLLGGTVALKISGFYVTDRYTV